MSLAGPAFGFLAAWLWGDRSVAWLATGTLCGAAAELLAVAASEREAKPGNRAVAFFLTFQAVLAAIPFLALSGLTEIRGAALPAFHVSQLVLVPAASAAAAAIRLVLRRPTRAERRARPPREPQPPNYARWLWTFGALSLLAAIAAVDASMPSPYSVDFLYVLPTLVVAWFAGPWCGFLVAVLAAEAPGIVRGFSHPAPLEPILVLFDFAVLAAGLFVAVGLLSRNRALLDAERAAARHDPLTGLANRKAFLERLDLEVERARRGAGPISIAYLDLDGFKAVNDTHGHAVGDEVLRIVAGALTTSLRADDLAARFGGDEFAVLLPETDPEVAPRIAERVRAEIEDRMQAFTWNVTCSVGMITSTAPEPSTPDLLRHADELMYEVKREGKNALRQAVLGGSSPRS